MSETEGEIAVDASAEEPTSDEGAEDEAEAFRLNPDTRRWTLASLLYHAPEPLSVRDIVALSEGEDWEMNQSQSSSELYNMHQDGLVRRNGQPYEYQLTEDGEEQLVQRARAESTPIDPDPFETE